MFFHKSTGSRETQRDRNYGGKYSLLHIVLFSCGIENELLPGCLLEYIYVKNENEKIGES